MAFISYAQNFEDVMLWRALGHIQNGFYIDVGAQHPDIDSVSKAFYDRGWRGIHIEPMPGYAGLLRQQRPDEQVLEVAISDKSGTLELNIIPETGLSTAVEAYAQRHLATQGLASCQKLTVPVLTLADVGVGIAGREVHWLKIDVEGLEGQVLKGWDSQSLRPWVVVIEATIPNSRETNYAEWEHWLVDAGYSCVYFDGLNRYYLAAERMELSPAFASPPNVFDDIRLTRHSALCQDVIRDDMAQLTGAQEVAAQAEARAVQAEAKAAQAEARAAQAEAAAAEINRQHQAVLSSKSWRLTLPLRLAAKQIQRVIRSLQAGRLNACLARFCPSLAAKIRHHSHAIGHTGDINYQCLSPRAAEIYDRLKQAIEDSKTDAHRH